MLAVFINSHGKTYFNRMTLKSSSPLDKCLLKEAWSKVMARHEMLRTGFIQIRDQQYPFAMITYQDDFHIPWREVMDVSSVELEKPVQQVLENLHRPPWQITIEESGTVTAMHFSALHSLYDAQSLQSILSDVLSVYRGRKLVKLAPINATLGPILIESQKQIQNAQEFWKQLAPEVHPSKFPDMHPVRTDRRELLSSSIRCSLSLQVLEDRCREMGVTLQAAGQVAWGRLLAAYSGEQNVTFGTVLSGRNLSAEAQDAVFPCLVTVPLPLRIEGTNKETLHRTLKRNASLTKNQFTPLAQIQHWISSDEPLFDTLFVYQKFAANSDNSEAWEVVDEETMIDVCVICTH